MPIPWLIAGAVVAVGVAIAASGDSEEEKRAKEREQRRRQEEYEEKERRRIANNARARERRAEKKMIEDQIEEYKEDQIYRIREQYGVDIKFVNNHKTSVSGNVYDTRKIKQLKSEVGELNALIQEIRRAKDEVKI